MDKWKVEIAKENYEIYRDYKSYREKWFKDAITFNNFRRGFHFTQTEEKEILAQRQAPIPINVTTAICETAEALLTSSDPIISVMPARFIDDQQRKIAQAVAYKYEAGLKSTWYNSLGSYNYDKVVQDYNNVGRGLMYVVPKFKNGEFFVDMKYLSFRDFYPDPNSRDPHYKDSENMVISYVTGQVQAYRFAKMYDPELEWKNFQDQFVTTNYLDNEEQDVDKYIVRGVSSKEKRLRIIIRMTLEEDEFYYVLPVQESDAPEQLVQSMQIYFDYQGLNWKKEDIPDEVQQFVSQGLLQMKSSKGLYLNEYMSAGNYGIKKTYPIDCFNIVPFTYDSNEHPYPLGRVHYIYPLQRALNKCLMISILNASLSNNTKWVAEEKSLVNIDNWTNNASKPGSFLYYRLLTDRSVPPQPIQPVPLSDAFLQFPRYLQYTMEYVSGITGVLMGATDEKTPDVYRTVAAMQTAGGERIKRRLRNLDSSLSVVGEVIAKFYKEYAPMNGEMTWIEGINKIKSEAYNQLKANPQDITKVMLDPETDLGIGFRSLRFVSTSNQGYENANMAQMLTLLATQLKVPEIVPVILKKLNIPETEEILESMDIKKQAEMTIGQLQERIKQLEGISQKQAGEIQKKSQELSVSEFNTKLVRTLEGFKTKFKDDLSTKKELDDLLETFNPSNKLGDLNAE